MKNPSGHWDEILEAEAVEQMREMGCDETFIECALEELRAGESVEIISLPGGLPLYRTNKDEDK